MVKAFSEDLKTIREEKKISLKDISQQTRLNISILENIERGDFTFQPQAYIRAFLKQYISCLGLDVEETLFDYDLARSGKYKSKVPKPPKPPEEIKRTEDNTDNIPASNNDKKNEADKTNPEVNLFDTETIQNKQVPVPEKSDLKQEDKSASETTKTPIKKSVTTINLNSDKKSDEQSFVKKSLLEKIFNSPVVRNISLILFACLLILGIYSIVNILFLDGSKDKPEIIRQNFDDVVKEQEKKILGKRTPEEIKDSIQKASELAASASDTITLEIASVAKGSIYIVTDSLNFIKPQKISFEKNEVGIFKAKKFFHLSSDNTSSFKAKINNLPLKFESKVNNVKITKDGISK